MFSQRPGESSATVINYHQVQKERQKERRKKGRKEGRKKEEKKNKTTIMRAIPLKKNKINKVVLDQRVKMADRDRGAMA